MNRIANLTRKNRVTASKASKEFTLDLNATKENQRRSTITMGDLISRTQREVVNNKKATPNCIKGRSKGRSLLVDEDDYEDDGMFRDCLETDEVEGDIMRSQDLQDEADQDKEYENDISEDLEEEDDVHRLEIEQHHPELEKAIGISKTTKRGPTMLHTVHMRKFDEREAIICNDFGQPIGPIREGKDVAGEFSRFLGTIARNHSYAPLIYSSWQKVPHKEKIWEYVLEKYDVPDAAKKWVLKSIGELYKVHKCRFKKKYFYQFKDNKTRWKNRPKDNPEADFSQLLRLWSNEDVAKHCLRAKESRMCQKNMHTVGPKSFARIREEMKNDDPNQELPTLTQLFERTRKRTEGRVYVDTYDDTARKIEQMKNYKPTEDENTTVDPFLAVMNKENYEYRRLYGRGVTNTLVKKVDGAVTSYMIPEGLMESFKANVEVEKNQLLEMRKEIEEDHERKKSELEAMQKDIDNQRQNLEAMMQKVMKRLPVGDRDG
ncbi:putative transposase, Ptta/En/Spm, plant [Helianthus debilis subsp. tardiflorus]